MDDVDYLIVGGGPAGLTAAAYLAGQGHNFLIVEQGVATDDRRHDVPEHLGQGVGGAGLYSDGKFSFFPSASELWRLADTSTLRTSYERTSDILAGIDITAPPFPDTLGGTGENASAIEKQYPSIYASLACRKKLIHTLSEQIGPRLGTGIRLLTLRSYEDHLQAYVWSHGVIEDFKVRAVIWCGGRFGPINLAAALPELPRVFRRFEIGVRIEQPIDAFFLADYSATDIKLIQPVAQMSAEWRTFCTCRNGEVVRVAGSPNALSGRADGAVSGRVNIGLNLRFKSLPESPQIIDEIDRILLGNAPEFHIPLNEYLDGNQSVLGEQLDDLFRVRLREIIPDTSNAKTLIHGPSIEGVGFYPDLNANLKVNSLPIWVAGDSTGIFRGLTAALVSGYYAATKAVEYWAGTRSLPSFVKVSPSRSMDKVFTAQSKAYFYCRDAICEFCLQKGVLPVNPFRIFDYFLGDRVPRDIVRRGNNQLVVDSDELWVFGPISDGVLYEILRARRNNKPVRFFSIATRADEIMPLAITELTFEPEIHSRQITRETLLALVNDNIAIESLEPPQLELEF